MPCWSRAQALHTRDGALRLQRRTLMRALVCGVLIVAAVPGGVAGAAEQTDAPVWQVERAAGALYLSARIPLELPAPLTEALLRGVPLHFMWRAEVLQPRWYWRDRQLSSVVRRLRLAYQPLTQRWRLSVSEGDGSDSAAALGVLHRYLDSLEEALALVRSVQRWPIASTAGLVGDERLQVEFRLDVGQLPRPLQILPGWTDESSLVWQAQLKVPPPLPQEASAAQEGQE